MPSQKNIVLVILLLIAGIAVYWSKGLDLIEEEYSPVINPADFSDNITNQFFRLPRGRVFIYEAQTDEGLEKVEIRILYDTKLDTRVIMGVKTLTYWDRVWLNGELVEDTRDYLAQDKAGNVWYFGEEVFNYEHGRLKDKAGSWIAGENGALPGIWIKSDNQVGDSYRQEYYRGEAEDMRDVVAVNQTVTTKLGTFEGCIKMYDWTPLDKNAKEHKYYCPSVGAMVLEEHIVHKDRMELISAKP